MGDGKTFEQAVRALDKLIAEQLRAENRSGADTDPVRLAYDRIVSAAAQPA